MAAEEVVVGRQDRLYQAVVGTGASLALALAVLLVVGQPQQPFAEVPGFALLINGLRTLAALCVAFLALGRYRFRREPSSYWVGIGFASYAVFALFYVLWWPGLAANGRSIIGHNTGAQYWNADGSQAVLIAFLLVAALRALKPPGRSFWLSVVAWGVASFVAAALLVIYEDLLPRVLVAGVMQPLATAGTYAVAAICLLGAIHSLRAYKTSRHSILGFSAIAQFGLAFSDAVWANCGARYTLFWYVGSGGLSAAVLVMLFLVLAEMVATYRREQERSVELETTAAEAEARTRELQMILDLAPDGIWFYGAGGEFLRMNEGARRMLGLSAEKSRLPIAERTPVYEAWGADGSRMNDEDTPGRRVMRGEVVGGQVVGIEREGLRQWLSISGVPVRDAAGSVAGGVMVATDITALYEAQEELRRHRDHLEELVRERTAELEEGERNYRELVQNARSAIVRWGVGGEIEFTNEYLEELFGYEPGELIGKPVTVLVAPTLSRGVTAEELIAAIVADPAAYEENENENVTKGGEVLWISWRNQVIKDDEGKPHSVMAIGHDRTAQHQAEIALQAQRKRLRHLTTELALTEHRERQTIATWLHDDIAQVVAYARLVVQSIGVMTSIEEAQGASREIAMLLGEVLQTTRNAMAELSPPILAELGLAGAIEAAAQQARERYGYEVEVTFEGSLRRLEKDANIILFQSVRELLTNAGKHANTGLVSISTTYGPGAVEIVVADEGVGFDPAVTTLSDTGGFGLLNIRERLEDSGGSFTIDSQPGEGSRFTLRLPIEAS